MKILIFEKELKKIDKNKYKIEKVEDSYLVEVEDELADEILEKL